MVGCICLIKMLYTIGRRAHRKSRRCRHKRRPPTGKLLEIQVSIGCCGMESSEDETLDQPKDSPTITRRRCGWGCNRASFRQTSYHRATTPPSHSAAFVSDPLLLQIHLLRRSSITVPESSFSSEPGPHDWAKTVSLRQCSVVAPAPLGT